MGVLREGLLEEKGKMNLTWPSQTIAMTKGTLDSPQNSCTNTLALDFYTVGGIVVKTQSGLLHKREAWAEYISWSRKIEDISEAGRD